VPLTQKRRLSTDARREQLLTAGAQLLAERPYAEVSIEDIAVAAGVSKGLLYHYFPTKKDFIMAAIERGEGELAALTAVDPDLHPAEQLTATLDRFLDFVEAHEAAYSAIFRSRGGGDADVQAALDSGRLQRMEAMMASLAAWEEAPFAVQRTPALETAVQGWFFFIEGAVLRWLDDKAIERLQLRELMGQALVGALRAAESVEAAD
jgi:AcrR family transcriptional regulator